MAGIRILVVTPKSKSRRKRAVDTEMSLGKTDFQRAWRDQGEDTSLRMVETAWRRYQQMEAEQYETILESKEPNTKQFEAASESLVASPILSDLIASYKTVTVASNCMPWKSTDMTVSAGSLVSTFATGRLWRSRLLDMFLGPQFGLYFRVGVNGRIFNSTRDTNTFQVLQAGEIYLAPQFPGQFSNPKGGRVMTRLKIWDLSVHKGAFQVLMVVWKENVTHDDIQAALTNMLHDANDQIFFGLVACEASRLTTDPRIPRGWSNLWFIGDNEIYTSKTIDNTPAIHCCPHRNVGILQKNFDPAIPFTKNMTVSWDWCVSALPSRLREDTTISHDYLSVAFEFENGRDLTYTWSWELPRDHGYWCPLPTWEDREYHIVVRSGPEELGEWLSEKRDLWADYFKYIGRLNMPCQIVRVWLIAGNRWQRYKGEMTVKRIVMGETKVL